MSDKDFKYYYKETEYLLRLYGVWPYENGKYNIIIKIFWGILAFGFIIPYVRFLHIFIILFFINIILATFY